MPMPNYPRLLALALLVAATAAASADAPWKLEKDADGIRIDSRPVEGWDIHEIRGMTRFEGRLSSLVAVLVDTSVAPELNDLVVESAVGDRDRDTRYRVYAVTDLPWPLKDRDVVMQREIVQDPATRTVTITDVAASEAVPQKDGLVRITRSSQQWTLTPGADGSVAIELRMLSDPNGPIPAALVNSLSIGTPFKTLSALKALAQRPPYADARLSFIQETSAAGS